MADEEQHSTEELERERLIFSSFIPAAILALRHGVSLKRLKVLLELAQYWEARRGGLKMREISEVLQVSMSKVGLLSSELKQHFAQPEEEHGLPRQILSLLWSTPLSAVRIVQALEGVGEAEVDEALSSLVEQGRVERHEGRTTTFALTSNRQRLDMQPWMAKLDGLNTLMRHVSRVIERRLIRNQPHAAVRNLAFRVRREDLEQLQALYEEVLFPRIVELDEAVDDDATSVNVNLSILWAADDDAASTPS